MSEPDHFKECLSCGTYWRSRQQFIDDPDVSLLGYQANFVKPEAGLFLFNHKCQGTMSIAVWSFSDLYSGAVFRGQKKGSAECHGYCLHRNEFRPCPEQCECAYVREILQVLGDGTEADLQSD